MLKSRTIAAAIPAIAVIVIAILFLSYAVYRKVEKSLTDIAIYRVSSLLEEARNEVIQDFAETNDLRRSISSNNDILYLFTNPDNQVQYKKAVQTLSRMILKSPIAKSHLSSIAIFTAKGKPLIHMDTWGKERSINIIPLHNYSSGQILNSTSRGASIHRSINTRTVYFSFPIFSNGIIIGNAELYLSMPKVTDLLKKYALRIDNRAILALSGVNGELFTLSNISLPGNILNISEFETLMRTTHPAEKKIMTTYPIRRHSLNLTLYQNVNDVDTVNKEVRNEVIAIIASAIIISSALAYLLLKLVLRKHVDEEKRLAQAVDLMHLPMWEFIAPGILHLDKFSLSLMQRDLNTKSFDKDAIRELIHPEDLNKHLFVMQADANDLEQLQIDKTMRFSKGDGSWYWLQMKGYITRSVSGDLQYAAGVFMDVHELFLKREQDLAYQRSLEKVVQEQYQRAQKNDDLILYEKSLLYNVINCIPDFIYFKNIDGNLLGGNQAFLTLINNDLTGIRGKPFEEINAPISFSAEDLRYFRQDDEVVIESEQIQSRIVQLIHDDGRVVPLEISKVAFRDHLGNAVGIVGIGRDISEHLMIEDALRKAKEAATAANTAKSEFLANMSHEIRTPLNGILGLNHLALQQNINDDTKEYLEKIELSAKTLLKIVNDILDFSKIEAGHIEIESIPFRLERSLQFGMDMLQHHADEKKIYLRVEQEGDIPEYILGDPLRFRQTMLNLLNNAVKFTSEGGVTLSIVVAQEVATHADITISVIDTGIGMNEEQIAKIFQPFIQADSSTTRRYGGTGLGLPITRSLIEAMGSKLSVTSTPNVGSTFSFTLHSEIPTEVAIEGQISEDATINLERIKGKKILLVEDNEINQLVATELLESFGLNVSVANDGQQGVDMALATSFDLILMDIQMPIMDGLTAAKTLRYNNYTKPIIAMTANAMAEDKEKATNAGMQAHIGKPIDIHELQSKLVKWLDDGNKT